MVAGDSISPLPEEADVVVVGAGMAGLAAAREIARAGARPVVLEARDRVGGRALSLELDRGTFDLGGQWVGPEQARLSRLASELEVPIFPTYCQGKKILDRDGAITRHKRSLAGLPLFRILELSGAIRRLERLAKEVPVESPAAARRAGALDRVSFDAWQRQAVRSRSVRELMDAGIRIVFGAEPCELSLLYFLFYVRTAGSLRRLFEIREGAQQDRFVPGAQELARRMAVALPEGAVLLGTPVRRIEQADDGVTVSTGRGAVRARYAVVAVPPALAGRIDYAPALPAARDQLTQRQPMGSTIKCVLTYDRPFWREHGLSGEVVATRGPVTAVFDNCSHDNAQPALVTFTSGREARRLGELAGEDRRRRITGALVRWFGEKAGRPSGFASIDWGAEPFSRGCPVGVLPPGVLTSFGAALREPVGRLHFAGTETATAWCGYLEGALESGERAAREVLARL